MASSLLFYGPLSDRYGRKPIILLALGLAIVGVIALGIYFTLVRGTK